MSFRMPTNAAIAILALIVSNPVAAGVVWENGRPIFTGRSAPSYGTPGYGARSYGYQPYWQGYGYYGYPWYGAPQRDYAPRRTSPQVRSGGPRPVIAAKAPETVPFNNKEVPGTIIIDSEARVLYYTLSETEAYKYPISVGREGFDWTGTEKISRIADWPDWYPPAEMRERQPELPVKMTGGLRNPLGVKALYLGKTLYRIHGTNDPKSIGQAASSGCFRMLNNHVVHLASLVDIGTVVRVVKHWPPEGLPPVTRDEMQTAAEESDEATQEVQPAESVALQTRAEATPGDVGASVPERTPASH